MSLAQALVPSSAASGSSSTPRQQSQANSKEPTVFEFTKRKRWADLLVTELSEAIILVLSPACKVWYCGATVSDLLGWRDEELVDGEFVDLMNADDRASFRAQFHESVSARSDDASRAPSPPLLVYVRLQCKNEFYVAADYASRPREVLFEITGRPHFRPGTDELICFFAVAKPYPSRNTAMLNTFLELKMENERLQQKLMHLRAQSKALDGGGYGHTPVASSSSQYQPPGEYYGIYDDGGAPSGLEAGGYAEQTMGHGDDDAGLDGPRKKLRRTITVTEQYVCVTCGRTDSPEWRKGPLGPKTLCNACGLRWAKKVRTDKSGQTEGEGESSTSALVF